VPSSSPPKHRLQGGCAWFSAIGARHYWIRPLWRPDGLGNGEHQVCLAHLIRDVQYAIDSGDAVFAPGLKACSSAPAPSGVDATLLRRHAQIYEADRTGGSGLMSLIPATKQA